MHLAWETKASFFILILHAAGVYTNVCVMYNKHFLPPWFAASDDG